MKKILLFILIASIGLHETVLAQVKQKKAAVVFNAANRPKNLSDSSLLDLVQ